MKRKPTLKSAGQVDRLTVTDVVWFLRLLPNEEREQAIELLRAIQDQQWREISREPLILGESG